MRISRHRTSSNVQLDGVCLVVRGRFELSGRHAGTGDLIVTAPLSARCLEAGELISAELSSPAPSLVHIPASEVRREPALSALAALLRSASSDPATRRLASTLLEPLLAFALHGRDLAPPVDRRVARALAAMEERLAERWTVAALAKLAGLSRAAFARRFLAEVGASPLRHLTELRMRRARELLLETDESLASIAGAIGYDSEFAFSRAFKRHAGVAPGAFRRRASGPVLRAAA